MRQIKCFFPGNEFPAVSVTADRCALRCPHCMGQPLSSMFNADTPEKLFGIATQLDERKAIGFLLSGGCDADGVLPLNNYLETIRQIKDTTDLKINAHIGFPRKPQAARIVRAGFDAFSINYPLSERFGREILSVPNSLARYRESVESLSEAGAKKIIPHVLLGLANPDEESIGLKQLAKENPHAIVFIAFFPLKGTPFEKYAPTSAARIIHAIKIFHRISSDTKLVLGCMRPRGYAEMERLLMVDLLDGIVMPNREVLRSLENKMEIESLNGCCSLYL